MSIASISYSSLKNASGEAEAVARKLDRYADRIEDKVYQKLNKYSGSWSSNLSTAKSRASEKISTLRDKANKYERYATDLTDLKEKCESTDKSVKSKVSSLTASFKEQHGIKNSPVVNAISYFFTSVGNETAIGRWLGDVKDTFTAKGNALLQSISDWFHFEGGKEFLKGSLIALLEIAIGVLAVVGAILSGGALLVVLAGVIAGRIAIANGITNLVNEGRALHATSRNDPATGRRLSSLDTFTDTIRMESDSRAVHTLTKGIDMVNTVATVVSVVGGLGSLLKNGYKWATGSTVDIKTLAMKDVLTKDAFTTFTGKIKTNALEVFTAASRKEWSFFREAAINFGSDFANNVKLKYWTFTDTEKKLSSVKSILETSSKFVKGGLTLKNAGGIALPIIPVASIPGSDSGIKVGDFQSSDITSIFKDIKTAFFDDGPLNGDVVDKLSTASQINISVPEIHIPGTN